MEQPRNFIEDLINKDLAEGVYDHVCTRFPPEPNGYLHIGHAKSILLNYSIAEKYNGKFNLRFDDTNPTKEKTEFVDSIKADVEWLGADFEDRCFFASDYFEVMYEKAVCLIDKGLAYVSDLSPLSGLTELRHLNVGVCYLLQDITPIYGLDLERFYIGSAHAVPQEQIDEFKRLHPDCEVNDVAYDTSNGRWRYADEYATEFVPRYALLREQFGYDERAYSIYWMDPNY